MTSVQSVERCLSVLEFLNVKNGATQREVCIATGLSRGSAYRSLETLRRQGFLRKDKGSLHYWLAERVRSLAMGYREQAWIEAHVRPEVVKLGREIKWPVKFLTLSGCDLVNRVTTDYESPFTEYKYAAGWRVSLMWTAAGRVYLSFCDPATRQILVDRVKDYAAPSSNGRAERTMSKDALSKMTQRIQRTGYEIRSLAAMASYSIAVPVLVGERVIGALSVMMFRATVSQQEAVEKVLPLMNVTAKTIGQNLAGESQDALFDSAADEVPPVLGPTKLVQPGRARKAR